MCIKLLIVSAYFSIAPSLCFAADNTAFIEQVGAGSVSVSQSGNGNKALIEQKSVEMPDTRHFNDTKDYQQKILNTPLTSSYARATYLADSGNRFALTKESANTPANEKASIQSSNHIHIYQNGKDNAATTTQTGNSNNVFIEQIGRNNSTKKVQNGEHNQSRIIVNGNEIENTDSDK